jgi:hypothetical protein
MEIEGSGTRTVQGDLIVGGIVHGCAINCTVVPYGDEQDGWFMKQFLTRQQMEDYAREHSLLIKEQTE